MTPLQEYLSLVYSWDGDHAHTWKSVDWVFITPDGQKKHAQACAQSFSEFERLIHSRIGFGKDVYVALGDQMKCHADKKSRDGYAKPDRTTANIFSHRSIYVDVDTQKPGAYATVQEASDAVLDMCKGVGLPQPTIMVESGGGLHCYWCMTVSISVDRWRQLAAALANAAKFHRLKFDSSCTTNVAGILRPPESFNHKRGTPAQVKMHHTGHQYAPEMLETALASHMGLRVVGGTQASALPPGPAGMANNKIGGNFTAGVGDAKAAPVDIYAIADAGCGVLSDALDTNGAQHPEPLWSQLMLAATFDIDPVAIAHEMSSGHPGYTKEATDQKLQYKLQYKAQNNIGWPTCASFSALHPACQTCPHLAAGKTPFHIAPKPGPDPTQPSAAGPLPGGWHRDAANCVYTEVRDKKTGEITQPRAFNYPIIEGWISDHDGSLVFKTHIHGEDKFVTVPPGSTTSILDLTRTLHEQGLYLLTPLQQHLTRSFMVAWAQHLQTMRTPKLKASTLGWDSRGFVYDDHAFGPKGTERVYIADRTVLQYFAPAGDRKYFDNAVKYVTHQKSPALECVLATAFAAPLVCLLHDGGMLFSCYSLNSAAGKTTAIKIAQSVWGCPTRGMNSVSDTENAIVGKLADLKHLPLNWDELKTENDMQRFISTVFRNAQNKDKSRLGRNSKPLDVRSFTTMLVACSNHSIAERLTHEVHGDAGVNRCFEVEAPPLSVAFSSSEVDAAIIALQGNYGHAGRIYAEYIGLNKDAVQNWLRQWRTWAEGQYHATPAERFWITTITTIIVGATIAKHLGLVDFHIDDMHALLASTLAGMRAERTESTVNLHSTVSLEELLRKLVASGRNDFMITTDKIFDAGNPNHKAINLDPQVPYDRVINCWAQYATETGVLRFVIRDFKEWLHKNKLPASAVTLLEKTYNGRRSRSEIGVGTKFATNLRGRTMDLLLGVTSPGSSPGAPSP